MVLSNFPIVASQNEIDKRIMNDLGKQNINDCVNNVKINNLACGKDINARPGCKYIVYDSTDDICYVPKSGEFNDDIERLANETTELNNNPDNRYKIILVNDGKKERIEDQIKILRSRQKNIDDELKGLNIELLKSENPTLTYNEIMEKERERLELEVSSRKLNNITQNRMRAQNDLSMYSNIYDTTNQLFNQTRLTENIQSDNVDLNSKLIQNMNNNLSSITTQIEHNTKIFDINDNFAYYLKIGLILSIVICIAVIILYSIKGKNELNNSSNIINKNYNNASNIKGISNNRINSTNIGKNFNTLFK